MDRFALKGWWCQRPFKIEPFSVVKIEPVLEKLNELKLNLAHNDRTGSKWQEKIADLIMRYPNVYTDNSYDTEMWYMPRRCFRSIKRMLETPKFQDRVLYGTDWYMGRWLWTEASYLKWFTLYPQKIFWCDVVFREKGTIL